MSRLPFVPAAVVSAMVLGACDTPGGPSTSTSAATTTSTSSIPAASKASGLGRLFAGLPDRGSVGQRPLRVPGATDLAVRIPPGWRSDTKGNALTLREKNKRALASFQAGFDRVSRDDIDRAAQALGFEDVAWGEGVDGQLGAERLPGTVSQGECKLDGEPARIWFIDVEVSGGKRLLVVAGGLQTAEDARQVLIECLRTVHLDK